MHPERSLAWPYTIRRLFARVKKTEKGVMRLVGSQEWGVRRRVTSMQSEGPLVIVAYAGNQFTLEFNLGTDIFSVKIGVEVCVPIFIEGSKCFMGRCRWGRSRSQKVRSRPGSRGGLTRIPACLIGRGRARGARGRGGPLGFEKLFKPRDVILILLHYPFKILGKAQ